MRLLFLQFLLVFSLPIAMANAKKSTPPPMKCMASPPWLENMLSITFFSLCEVHSDESRNDCNMYCVDCFDQAYCNHCIESSHEEHRVIQIRKSSYSNVVRVSEIQKALDIAKIQTYVINGAKVVFIRTRAPTSAQNNPKVAVRMANKTNHHCATCTRTLVDPTQFCSLQCKFEWAKKNEDENSAMDGGMARRPEAEEEVPQTQRVVSPSTEPPKPSNYNSRKRKGIPRRAPFF